MLICLMCDMCIWFQRWFEKWFSLENCFPRWFSGIAPERLHICRKSEVQFDGKLQIQLTSSPQFCWVAGLWHAGPGMREAGLTFHRGKFRRGKILTADHFFLPQWYATKTLERLRTCQVSKVPMKPLGTRVFENMFPYTNRANWVV